MLIRDSHFATLRRPEEEEEEEGRNLTGKLYLNTTFCLINIPESKITC
jgi:hypothetical protein